MKISSVLVTLGLLTLSVPTAEALPRFAARNGNECIQCHINPSGGGMRNAYGRNVYARLWLPRATPINPEDFVAGQPAAEDEGDPLVFNTDLTDWMALGGDIRAAYLYVRPDRGRTPGTDPDITSSFFLMQADLYHAMTLNEHVTTVFDVGIYSGFEAWALFRLQSQPSPYDLMLKVGHFMPAFGIREVEHQLYTREGIGLGATDRDTGLEATAYAGPFTLSLSLLNGVLGDTSFDTHGTERQTFEMAAAGRASLRGDFGWARGQVGASFYWNHNTSQANPLLAGSVNPQSAAEVSLGVNEVRAGGFLTANVGRFTYLADFAWVQNEFKSRQLVPLRGYASYQELSFLPTQGLDLVATFEFADPDVDLRHNGAKRVGFIVEYFPWSFTELRAMVRRSWRDNSPTGGSWDIVFFTHLFI